MMNENTSFLAFQATPNVLTPHSLFATWTLCVSLSSSGIWASTSSELHDHFADGHLNLGE